MLGWVVARRETNLVPHKVCWREGCMHAGAYRESRKGGKPPAERDEYEEKYLFWLAPPWQNIPRRGRGTKDRCPSPPSSVRLCMHASQRIGLLRILYMEALFGIFYP